MSGLVWFDLVKPHLSDVDVQHFLVPAQARQEQGVLLQEVRRDDRQQARGVVLLARLWPCRCSAVIGVPQRGGAGRGGATETRSGQNMTTREKNMKEEERETQPHTGNPFAG